MVCVHIRKLGWYLNACIVYRPKLRRRLQTLEKRLQMPEDERHVCDARLEPPKELYIRGDRIRDKIDTMGKLVRAGVKRKGEGAGNDDKQQVLQFAASKLGAALQAQLDTDKRVSCE